MKIPSPVLLAARLRDGPRNGSPSRGSRLSGNPAPSSVTAISIAPRRSRSRSARTSGLAAWRRAFDDEVVRARGAARGERATRASASPGSHLDLDRARRLARRLDQERRSARARGNGSSASARRAIPARISRERRASSTSSRHVAAHARDGAASDRLEVARHQGDRAPAARLVRAPPPPRASPSAPIFDLAVERGLRGDQRELPLATPSWPRPATHRPTGTIIASARPDQNAQPVQRREDRSGGRPTAAASAQNRRPSRMSARGQPASRSVARRREQAWHRW